MSLEKNILGRGKSIATGRIVSFPYSSVEVLTSSTLGCDCICRYNLERSKKGKTRSYGWSLIQYDCCLYEKWDMDTHRDDHGSIWEG